jgi:hypothetical protein
MKQDGGTNIPTVARSRGLGIKDPGVKTVGQYIDAESWLERYDKLGIEKTV